MLFSVLCVAGRCVAKPSHSPGDCKLSENLPSPLALHFTPMVWWHLAGPFPLSGIYAKLGNTQFDSQAEFSTTKSQWFFPAFGKSFPRCWTLPWFLHRVETQIFFPTARYYVFLGYPLLYHVSKIYPRLSSDVSPAFSWDLLWWYRQSTENVMKTETMFPKPGDCKKLFWAKTDATGDMEQLRGLTPGL